MTALHTEVGLGASGLGDGLLRAGKRSNARDHRLAAFVIQLVALSTGVQAGEIACPTRHCGEAARARQIAIYLTHTACAWPLARVAAVFGRDRTTCSYAVKRVEDLRSNPIFDLSIARLERCVRAAPLCIDEIDL